MTTFEKVRKGLQAVFNAIPKGKWQQVSQEAQDLEIGIGEMTSMLSKLRAYFIDTTGEESPFVAKIDEMIPRPKS